MAGDRGRSQSEKSDYSGEGDRSSKEMLPSREDSEPGRKQRDERDDSDTPDVETEEGRGSRRKSEKISRRSESDDGRKRRGSERSRRRSRKRYSSESDSDGSTSDDSESESSDSDSESEEDRRRRKRRERRRREEEEMERKRRKEKKRRRKERDEEDDERRKRKKKKEKKRRKEKERVERGKTGAVTNSWGKYGTIRETDMWTKRPEFTAWLAEVKQVNLEHLANWEEKQMFKDFMEDYNTATFPSKKYYNLDAYHKREMEKQLKKGMKKVQQKERTVFNDEEQRRLELLQERERQKEEEVNALKQSMQSGLAQAMKEQALLREEMAYQYKLGNFEAAAAIQRRLDPNIAP